MRWSRRQAIAAALGASILPRPSRAGLTLGLAVMGQALIQHDLRRRPWPGFATLGALFARADLAFTDLETAIRSVRAEKPTREGVFLHTADPVVIDCLKDWHIGLVATANNHAFDLGTGGIVGALDELDARGVAHAGSGLDLAAAAAPGYVQTAGGTAALVAAASGAVRDGGAATPARAGVNEMRVEAGVPNPDDAGRVLAAVTAAAARADLVIAYHHNHVLTDKGHQVPAWQVEFAHRCIDAGAGLFVSHGAPWLLGIELYRGRPIFYDLGSLVFQTATAPGEYDDTAWQSVVAECRFAGGKTADITLTPVQLDDRGIDGDPTTRGRPSLARGGAAAAILDRLAALSAPFGTVFERVGETAIIRPA